MKIHLEDEDRLEVVVPSQSSSVDVFVVDDRRTTVVEVWVKDGLIGEVREYVARRYPEPPPAQVEDRLVLWGHLVSAHAAIIPLHATLEELQAMHRHEHNGPGTIRNHSPESRHHSLVKIGKVLGEAGPEYDMDTNKSTIGPSKT